MFPFRIFAEAPDGVWQEVGGTRFALDANTVMRNYQRSVVFRADSGRVVYSNNVDPSDLPSGLGKQP